MAKKDIDEQTQASGNDAEHKSLRKRVEEGTVFVVQGIEEEIAGARRPWYNSVRWGQVLLTVYAILLAFFALLAWWVHFHPIIPLDVKITREFQENQTPWLRITMLAVSYIGNNLLLSTGLVILAAVIFWIVRLRLEAVTVLFVSATSAILNYVVKLIVARPRPNAQLVEILQQASGQSFPSGHVMSYIAFWGLLFSFTIILFKGHSWWRLALLIIPALFIILVGPSRVYLGDHWASDVLGGYIFGGVWLGICLWGYLKLKGKGVLEPRKQGLPKL